jgi:hypothetical protein
MYKLYVSANVNEFYPYVLAYMILYMPTIALVNSVSFNQLNDPEKEFSNIRVLGTIGWVVAGLLISYLFHLGLAGECSKRVIKKYLPDDINSLLNSRAI